MMIRKLRICVALSLGIIGVVLVGWAYFIFSAIRVVSLNAQVGWAQTTFGRTLQNFSSSAIPLGLPEHINIQHEPNDPQEFVEALGRLPNTVRSVTISIGDSPLASRVLDEVIEMEGVSKVIALGCTISDESLARLTESLSLRTLVLSGNQQSFHHFSENSCVEVLEVEATMLDVEGLNRILTTRKLKELSIVGNTLGFTSLLNVNWDNQSLEMLVLGDIGEVSAAQIHTLVNTIKKGSPKVNAVYVNNQMVAR